MRKSIITLWLLLLSAAATHAGFPVGTAFFKASAAGGGMNDAAAAWNMDEASAQNRLDSTANAQTLTSTLTLPNTTTGHIVNCAVGDSAGGGTALTRSHAAGINFAGTDFTLAGWINTHSSVSTAYIFDKYAGSSQGWILYANGGPLVYRFQDIDLNSGISINVHLNEWIFILISLDNTTHVGRILIADSTGTVLADTTGVASTSISETTAILQFNGLQGTNTGTSITDYDAFVFYKRLLTAGEITNLINGGAGKQYPY